MEKATNRPLHEIRYGAVRATIWLNQTANGPMHSVTVSRIYKDGDTWKESGSFAFDELLTLSKALGEAHTFIHGQKTARPDEA